MIGDEWKSEEEWREANEQLSRFLFLFRAFEFRNSLNNLQPFSWTFFLVKRNHTSLFTLCLQSVFRSSWAFFQCWGYPGVEPHNHGIASIWDLVWNYVSLLMLFVMLAFYIMNTKFHTVDFLFLLGRVQGGDFRSLSVATQLDGVIERSSRLKRAVTIIPVCRERRIIGTNWNWGSDLFLFHDFARLGLPFCPSLLADFSHGLYIAI